MNIWSEVQLTTVEIIFIPINVEDHWISIVAKVKKRKLEFYDPQGVTNVQDNKRYKHILSLLEKELKNLFKMTEDWIMSSPLHVNQNDNMSCGLFVCFYAYKIKNNLDIACNLNTFEFRRFMYNFLEEECLAGDKYIQPNDSQYAIKDI
ncbi:uncharacterized protein LOC118203720 [Stegodyphus dumicola]|uniref:uncharacterized protein LOC118203720 n=1 Tax=Stegodyphus dumicola TaxID=202533 RepID=UPI0015AB9A5B|nr:uncharacterized protein LOC118203720 [Stegodyphus dumicola]